MPPLLITPCLQVMPVSKSSIFRWANIWPSNCLPSRVFFGLVNAASYRGDLKRKSLYFETGGVQKVRVLVNGREILPEPIVNHIKSLEADDKNLEADPTLGRKGDVVLQSTQALGAVMAMTRALELLDNRDASQGIPQDDWITGHAIYAVDLPGYGSNSPKNGDIDIVMEFKGAPSEQYVAVAMGEFNEILACSGPERAISAA